MEPDKSAIPRRPKARRVSALSYKFQRLREKLRAAVTSGELTGKLPGERELARRFSCNAKTLSKALTDLAAEGLLDRQIGRGTYVKGSKDSAPTTKGPWLILCPPDSADTQIIRDLVAANPDSKVITEAPSPRPSFINQFTGIVDFTGNSPANFVRDAIIRNIPLVLVGHEPKVYSTHAVIVDNTLGSANLGRDLVMAGHRKILAVEERGSTSLTLALRQVAARYAPDAVVDAGFASDVAAAIEYGVSAIVCNSAALAGSVLKILRDRNVDLPAQLSVAAVGFAPDDVPCTGYYVRTAEKVDAIVRLLGSQQSYRPTILWLTPTYVDRGTVGPVLLKNVHGAPLVADVVPYQALDVPQRNQ